MASKKILLGALSLTLVIAVSPWSRCEASIVGETVLHLQCSESGQESLPKRLTMLQIVADGSFASAPYVGLEVFASYPFRFDVDSGKVVVNGILIKADGTEIDLPRMAARMRYGDADNMKSTNVIIDRGDIIEWKIKLKGLVPLAGLADCFTIQVGVLCSETLPFTSLMAVSSGLQSRKQ